MRRTAALATLLLLTFAITSFFWSAGRIDKWSTLDFSAFGTLLGGLVGPLTLVFAALQFSESKKAERNAQMSRDLQVQIERKVEQIDYLLNKSDIEADLGNSEKTTYSIGYFLTSVASELPENPVPNFKVMQRVAKERKEKFFPASTVFLFERCAKISIFLNRLREICIAHDRIAETNLKCLSYGDDYYRVITSLTKKGYDVKPWPTDLHEILKN